MTALRRVAGLITRTVEIIPPRAEQLLLVVPGNPGIGSLYGPFGRELVARSGGTLAVATASLAGHAPGERAEAARFGLDAQVAHQLSFLRGLPSFAQVHVVGHSIGAWIGLRVLDQLSPEQRGRGLLLLPTIERMAQMPAGQRLARRLVWGRTLLPPLAGILRILPGWGWVLERWLLQKAPQGLRAELRTGLREIGRNTLRNALNLAREELDRVVDLPDALLRRHASKVSLLYGVHDPWQVPGMPEGVSARYPGIEALYCPPSVGHAFVLEDVSWIAQAVVDRVSLSAT